MDVALGLARGHQGCTPYRSAADGHHPLAGQHAIDQQLVALAMTHRHLTARKALTVELDIDNRLAGVVYQRRVGCLCPARR